jgi:hypothetical protein
MQDANQRVVSFLEKEIKTYAETRLRPYNIRLGRVPGKELHIRWNPSHKYSTAIQKRGFRG